MNKYARFAKTAQANNHRLRSCESKRRYITAEEATCKNQTVYKCEYCGGYHRSAAFNTFVNILRKARMRHEQKQS